MNADREQTLALAPMFQALGCVQQLAETGRCDAEASEALIDAIFAIDSADAESLYPPARLKPLGFLLSQLQAPEFPLPLGIFRNASLPAYEELCADQAAAVVAEKGSGHLESLLQGSSSWTVSAES